MPARAQLVRESVRAPMHLLERERPALVDDRRTLREAGRRAGIGGGRRGTPALERDERTYGPVGPHRREHAGPEQDLGDFQAMLQRRAHAGTLPKITVRNTRSD